MNPEQTAPLGAVCSGSTLFALRPLKYFSRLEKQTTFVAIGALSLKNGAAQSKEVALLKCSVRYIGLISCVFHIFSVFRLSCPHNTKWKYLDYRRDNDNRSYDSM